MTKVLPEKIQSQKGKGFAKHLFSVPKLIPDWSMHGIRLQAPGKITAGKLKELGDFKYYLLLRRQNLDLKFHSIRGL